MSRPLFEDAFDSNGSQRNAKQPLPSNGVPKSMEILLRAVSSLIEKAVAAIQSDFKTLREQMEELSRRISTNSFSKEYFNVAETAKILEKNPYTVREWCRNARINALKTGSGRGESTEWRISKEEIARYQNEGLLPIKRDRDIRHDRFDD